MIIAAVTVIFMAYNFFPWYVQSLSVNPQISRLGWSTWWTMLSDAIVINRVIGYLTLFILVNSQFIFLKLNKDRSYTLTPQSHI